MDMTMLETYFVLRLKYSTNVCDAAITGAVVSPASYSSQLGDGH